MRKQTLKPFELVCANLCNPVRACLRLLHAVFKQTKDDPTMANGWWVKPQKASEISQICEVKRVNS